MNRQIRLKKGSLEDFKCSCCDNSGARSSGQQLLQIIHIHFHFVIRHFFIAETSLLMAEVRYHLWRRNRVCGCFGLGAADSETTTACGVF